MELPAVDDKGVRTVIFDQQITSKLRRLYDAMILTNTHDIFLSNLPLKIDDKWDHNFIYPEIAVNGDNLIISVILPTFALQLPYLNLGDYRSKYQPPCWAYDDVVSISPMTADMAAICESEFRRG